MGDSFEKLLAVPTSQKAALLVLLMGGIGAAWYFMFFEGTMNAIAAETRKMPQLVKEREELKTKLEKLAEAEQRIETLKKKRLEMQQRLPEDAEIADLLNRIHQQAKYVGLDITLFKRGIMVPEQLYARIPVEMVLKGTFSQITQFFYSLGKLTRLVNVEDIALAIENRDPQKDPMLVATCTATTFMYLTPEKAAALAAKGKKKGGGH